MTEDFQLSRLPEIYFGAGAIQKTCNLLQKYGKSVLLITGSSFFERGQHGVRLLQSLKSANIREKIITISVEPTIKHIDEITGFFRQHPPPSVLSIGGGSVIDAGKAISAMIPVEGNTWTYMEGNADIKPHSGAKVPFIAVPTTAGTGSEATKNAVLSTTGLPALKRSLRHNNFVPDVAIIDPELSLTCPPEITAASGLDAITQLLEACVSTQASPFTDALAFCGLKKAINSIYKVIANGNDIEARSDMAYAALLSGIVLANAGLGAVHGFASVLGAYYKIPHGIICGSLLGAVTRANINKLIKSGSKSKYIDKYTETGKLFCTMKHKSNKYYLMCLADMLDKLIDDLKIPRLGQYGIKSSETVTLAEKIQIKNNPVNLCSEELEIILNSRL